MQTTRTRRVLGGLAVALAMGAGSLVAASPAVAQEHDPGDISTLPIELIPCNLDDLAPVLPANALITLCIEITFDDGQARFGNIDTEVEGPIKVRQVVAVAMDPNTFEFGITMVDETPGDGGGLAFPPIAVPGGLLGAPAAPLDPVLAPVTGVDVTIEPLGDLALNDLNTDPLIGAMLGWQDPGPFTLATANLPLRVKVNNLLLGETCYVGSAEEPIELNLPLEMSGFQYWQSDDRSTIPFGYTVFDVAATDGTFAIPGASGCGLLGLGEVTPLFNDLLNSAVGLPAPAGTNLLSFAGKFGITIGGADGITCGAGLC